MHTGKRSPALRLCVRDVVHRWDNSVCPVMQEAVRSDQVDVDLMETQRSWCVAPNGPGVPTQILEPLHAKTFHTTLPHRNLSQSLLWSV